MNSQMLGPAGTFEGFLPSSAHSAPLARSGNGLNRSHSDVHVVRLRTSELGGRDLRVRFSREHRLVWPLSGPTSAGTPPAGLRKRVTDPYMQLPRNAMRSDRRSLSTIRSVDGMAIHDDRPMRLARCGPCVYNRSLAARGTHGYWRGGPMREGQSRGNRPF